MIRIGSVSFLNAKPLIYGLDEQPDLQLRLAVPSRLLQGLTGAEYDLALLPTIDYQRLADLLVLGSGGIGCDGPTLTVRIYSQLPLARVRRMACDSDSHTSLALAQVILAERYGARPQLLTLRPDDAGDVDAVLLIGDKVIGWKSPRFGLQIDLGEQWKQMTGLPFVFAAWMARRGTALGDLPQRLVQAKQQGLAHLDQIVRQYAPACGWPADVALDYLAKRLVFDIGPRQVQAMELFYRLAGKHGLLDGPVRALRMWQ